MTLKRLSIVGGTIALVVLMAVAIFLGNQRPVQALEVQDPGLPTQCSDSLDNDNDGVMDFVLIPFAAVGDPDCESIFDDSESGTSGSGEGGGNGNPPLSQCMDGIDNDNDGDIDLADDGCVNVGDNDESNDDGENGGGETPTDVCPNIDGVQTEVPAGKVLDGGNCVDAPDNGGGSGGGSTDPTPTTGGGGGGGTSSSGGGSGGEVLGATTTEAVVEATTTPEVISCDTYLTAFIKAGQKNDLEQVKRLQSVLKNYEAADVEENGEYDAKTLDAVKVFQSKYASEILTPWGIQKPTGYVFLTTRKKVNEVYCKNAQTFPLTEEEEQQIAQARASADTEVKTPTMPAAVKPLPAKAKTEEKKPVETKPVTSADETSESAVDLPASRITDFFRRLFDRFR